MKKILFLLVIFLVGCTNNDLYTEQDKQWMVDHPVIYVAPDPDFGPIEFFTEDFDYHGIASDYIKWFNQELPIDFEIIRYENWSDVLDAIKNKEVDMLGAVTPNNERGEYLLFTDSFVEMPTVIITRNDYVGTAKLEELAGKSIVVIDDYATEDYLEEFYTEIEIVTVQTVEEGLTLVSLGKEDYMMITLGQVSHAIEENSISNLKTSGKTPLSFVLSFGVRDDYQTLIDILNKTLDDMPNKEKKDIYDKWINFELPTINKTVYYGLLILLGIIIVIVLIVVFFNITLRSQVNDRTEKLNLELEKKLKAEEDLDKLNQFLEKRVNDRTKELEIALEDLKLIQSELIESEKQASLSRMLVGISHNFNTTLGSTITLSSYLKSKLKKLDFNMRNKSYSFNQYQSEMEKVLSSLDLVIDELDKSRHFIELIRSISDLELTHHKSSIDLCVYLSNLENIYSKSFKSSNIQFNFNCNGICMITDEQALNNIFVVLIKNSISHGFENLNKGKIEILITEDENAINIEYKDNGVGINDADVSNIFEPFFTSNMGEYKGIGMSVLYNTVHHVFKGTATLMNEPGFKLNIVLKK